MVAVVLIEGKMLAGAHTVDEIRVLRNRIRHLGNQIHHIRDGALESFVDLALRTFDIRNLALAFKAFALENDLAAIIIRIGDAAPNPDCIRMLLRGIHLHLDREGVILAEEILHRVDIVLPHVRKPAAIIVPVAPEGLVYAVRVVRLVRCRAKPHVVVESSRYSLGDKVLVTRPEEFPRKARGP